jgi:perosamine synthetase
LTEVHNHVEIPTEQPWAKHAFWSYPVILRDSVAICRDDVMKALEEDAIETRPVFHPMHTLPPYRDARGEYPIADRLATRGLCLPMHGLLNEDHICYISQRLAHWCTYSGT